VLVSGRGERRSQEVRQAWRGAALGRTLKISANLLFHVQGLNVCIAGGSRERSKRVVCLLVRNGLFEPTARQNIALGNSREPPV
jgi:hypothetical protein